QLIQQYGGERIIVHELYLSTKYRVGESQNDYGIDVLKANKWLHTRYNYIKKKYPDFHFVCLEGTSETLNDVDWTKIKNPRKKNEAYLSQFYERLMEIEHSKRPAFDVAVVIAAYNCAPYLEECVRSVFNQTHPSVQCVVVDDGSTDDTEHIANSLKTEFPEMKYVRIRNSGSPSKPRNIGVEHADASFITFLDGDDYLAPTACEHMVHIAKSQNADLVIGNMYSFIGEHFFPTGQGIPKYRKRLELFQNLKSPVAVRFYKKPELYLIPSACGKLYSRALIEGQQFDESLKYGEDHLFSVETALEARNIWLIPDTVYYYRGRTAGDEQSTTQQRTVKNMTDLKHANERIYNQITDLKNQKIRQTWFESHLWSYRFVELLGHIDSLLQYDESERETVLRLLHDAYLTNCHSEQQFSHFTLFNYLKIRLLFERRLAHLEQLLTVMNQLRYYDFIDSYPFSCEEKNGTVLFNVDYRDFAFSVDVTMPISKA
ncbi:MAG: glycosyltransferase family 2 protein, partial [Bacilli bacterium]